MGREPLVGPGSGMNGLEVCFVGGVGSDVYAGGAFSHGRQRRGQVTSPNGTGAVGRPSVG